MYGSKGVDQDCWTVRRESDATDFKRNHFKKVKDFRAFGDRRDESHTGKPAVISGVHVCQDSQRDKIEHHCHSCN